MTLLLITYFILLILFVVITIYLCFRDRNSYMKVACQRLLSTIKCMNYDLEDLECEIEKVYMCYSSNVPSVKRLYPNVVMWIEDVVYRINTDNGYARELRPYIKELRIARDKLAEKYPFADCEKYQQEILRDLKKIEFIGADSNSDIIIENLISRIKGEFNKLNLEVKKNNLINHISIFFTILSIIVTIITFIN